MVRQIKIKLVDLSSVSGSFSLVRAHLVFGGLWRNVLDFRLLNLTFGAFRAHSHGIWRITFFAFVAIGFTYGCFRAQADFFDSCFEHFLALT